MNKKLFHVLIVYTVAAIAVLSVLSAVLYERTREYERTARYASSGAFETAVKASRDMSGALEKSLYAADSGMCARLCGEIYANALAAEAAISALPFDTYELEHISGFVNTVGDYAYTLCADLSESGFTPEQAENLHRMSAQAELIAQKLREIQEQVHNGAFVIDETQTHLYNVTDSDTRKLSDAMLELEGGFDAGDGYKYDGQYASRADEEKGTLSEEEILSVAAAAAGVEPRELRHEYDYEGENSRRCYSAGGMTVVADASGLCSVSRSRLVVGGEVSEEDARKTAESYLAQQGFENLTLRESAAQNGLVSFRYAAVQNEAVCEDNYITVSVAADNGEIYSLNAENYSPDIAEVQWKVTEEEARKKLPQGIELQNSEKTVIKSPGGRSVACYEFVCADEKGEKVKIYVSGETGRQYKIEVL